MKKSREQRRREAIAKRKKAQKILQQKRIAQTKKAALKQRWYRMIHAPFYFSWKAFAVLAIVIGLVASLVTFKPRVSVSSSESLNPSDPFATPFVVSNDGNVSISDISSQLLIRRIVVANRRDIDVSNNLSEDPRPMPIPLLIASEKSTIIHPTAFGFDGPITWADIDVVVSFGSWWPFRQEKRFRFSTEISADKKLHWFPRASSE